MKVPVRLPPRSPFPLLAPQVGASLEGERRAAKAGLGASPLEFGVPDLDASEVRAGRGGGLLHLCVVMEASKARGERREATAGIRAKRRLWASLVLMGVPASV